MARALDGANHLGVWREHSGRHNMPSWVAALLDCPEEHIAHLGGWAVSGSSIKYIGTVERRILTMQSKVAASLRSSRGGRDTLDEDGLFYALGAHLRENGMNDEAIEIQLSKLNWFQVKGSVLESEGAAYAGTQFEDGFDFE